MKHFRLAGTIPALALVAVLGTAPDAQAATVTGSVVFNANGQYSTSVVDDGSGGPVGYEIDISGTGTLSNTLSSQTDVAPGWVVSSEGSVSGNNISDINYSLSDTITGPRSFNDLGDLPVAPGGTVTFATSLALLQDPALFGTSGSGFTFGGGQNILPAGDTITGTINFTSGAFDLLFKGDDAVASLEMYTGFLVDSGILSSGTVKSIFGTSFERGDLAVLPDSGNFSKSVTISAVPVPAALPLLLAGLGGLGVVARRKRKAA